MCDVTTTYIDVITYICSSVTCVSVDIHNYVWIPKGINNFMRLAPRIKPNTSSNKYKHPTFITPTLDIHTMINKSQCTSQHANKTTNRPNIPPSLSFWSLAPIGPPLIGHNTNYPIILLGKPISSSHMSSWL